MDTKKLEEILQNHEGYRRYAYVDSLGYTTIGYGRCLDSRKGNGLDESEALYLLRNDIRACMYNLQHYTWYTTQDDVRKCALIELAFNLGMAGLLAFKKTLFYLEKRDYKRAALELLDSKWTIQVGPNRSKNIAFRLENGTYPV